MSLGRRDLLLGASAVAAAAPTLASRSGGAASADSKAPGPICFFSKFLPKMTPRDMARACKGIGYAGIDLTVRPKDGHVRPENVVADLPAAVEAIRAEGLTLPLITTALTSASDPSARPILTTAAKAGVPLFKPGYWNYEWKDIRRELRQAGQQVRALADLAKQSKIQLGFHNHGGNLGGSLWDVSPIIDSLDPRWAGYYFDTRHAFAEGGQSGWKLATHLVAPRCKAVSVKDFHWEKTSKGWEIKKVPLGQGMVDLVGIFTILAGQGWKGPISLHLEYPIEGGDDAVLKAAERDLRYLEKQLAQAYGSA